jgi:hypothetical protein
MFKAHRSLITLLGYLVFFVPIKTTAQTVYLSKPTQRVLFDGAAFIQGTALPQWTNGYLVARQVETLREGTPNVWLYAPSGNKARQAAIWFPQSERVLLYSAVATREGRIIVSGKAEKATGEGVTFIAMTDLGGNVTDTIQTMGFAPVNICQAPDGSIWSYGGTGYDDQSRPNLGDTLRRFDFHKGEVASYLPRTSFPEKLHPGPEVNAQIRCSAGEVVTYSPSGRRYIVLKYGSETPQVYQVESAPPNQMLTGFAAIDSQQIFAQFSRGSKTGLYVLSIDGARKSANWRAVDKTVGSYSDAGVITRLFGSDSDKLLVNLGDDQAGEAAIHWVSPLRQ